MSYILDALRKAETERALTLASCIASPQHKGSARSGLAAKRNVLLVIAVVCAMAITWWWARYTITMPAQSSSQDTGSIPNQPLSDVPAGATALSTNPQPSPRRSLRLATSTPVPDSLQVASSEEELSVAGEAAPPSLTDENKTKSETVVLTSDLPVREADRPATGTADIETVQGIPSTVRIQDEANVTEKVVATPLIGEAQALELTATVNPPNEESEIAAQTTVDEQTEEVTPTPVEPEPEPEPLPPLLRTLPYRFQTTLPKMVINAQAYAEEADARFVIINMKKYREGDRSEAGIVVEQIAESYLVMSYQGQVFRMQR